jgi:hypothetical protein
MVGLTLNGKTINEAEVKVLAVLGYMFHGSCRKVSKVLSLALELIRKSAVRYLAKKVSEIRVAKEPRYGRCMAVDENKLRVKKSYVYIWSAVDVDSKELLALEASYDRGSLNALAVLKKALKMCTNKPLVIEVLQIPKGENCGIPPQDECEKPRTGNHEPQAIPNPIHNILSGCEDREMSENAYLDTI